MINNARGMDQSLSSQGKIVTHVIGSFTPSPQKQHHTHFIYTQSVEIQTKMLKVVFIVDIDVCKVLNLKYNYLRYLLNHRFLLVIIKIYIDGNETNVSASTCYITFLTTAEYDNNTVPHTCYNMSYGSTSIALITLNPPLTPFILLSVTCTQYLK